MNSLKKRWALRAGAVLIAFAGISACAGVPTETIAPMGTTGVTRPDDRALASTVLDALRKTPGLESEEIVVTAHNGVITLGGWAHHPDQESHARAVASRVPGVAQAYSRIHLWSTSN